MRFECRQVVPRLNSSSIILRKRVIGISFRYDPHYVSCAGNLGAHPRASVRRASGLVLIGNREVVQKRAAGTVSYLFVQSRCLNAK